MDVMSILSDMITSGLGLSLVGGAFLLWWLSGRIPNLFSETEWSWKRGLEDLCKALLMGTLLVGGTGLLNAGGQFFAGIGWDITEATEAFSTYALAGAMAGGFVFYMGKALNNGWTFFRLTVSNLTGNKEKFEEGAKALTQNVVNGVVQFFTQKQENIDHHKEYEEIGGRGAYYSVPINTYDVFRGAVIGKGFDIDGAYGWQCWDGCALLWQQIGRNLITGNGCASGCWGLKRDINAGNDFQLIWDAKDVKRGDIVVFSAGQYGHIAFADEDYNGSGALKILGQNQGVGQKGPGGGYSFTIVNMSMASFMGAFRFKKWATNNAAPAAPLKDLNTVAQEVIAGKWGNNPERAAALRAAGYDADEVQSIVNGLSAPTSTPTTPTTKTKIKEGDSVTPTKLVDYTGRPLRSYYSVYTVKQLKGDRAVLYVGDACWAALNVANLKKA